MIVWIFNGGDGYKAISSRSTPDHLPKISEEWDWDDPISLDHCEPADLALLERDGYILVKGGEI